MTHPTDDSLKPCPFCGSPAEYDDEIPLMVSVQCTQCECMTNGHGDHEEAARTWNKRAEIRSEEISLLNAPAPLLKAEQAKDAAEDAPKLWLWQNFVDGRPEYWAFDNPYPINLTDGDPQTLGEPCGYAIFKPSRQGRFDKSEEQVLGAIARAARAAERKA